MKNILIVDDHPLILGGLTNLIKDLVEKCVIHYASNYPDALSLVGTHTIELILLDLNIPGSRGIEMVGGFRKVQPGVRILICSGRDELVHAGHFIQRGANGFLPKTALRKESETAIKMVLDNKTYLSENVQNQLIQNVIHNQMLPRDPITTLTAREKEVLQLLLAGKWSKEIADELKIKHSTVGTLKGRIFQKLQVENLLELYKKMELYNNER